MGSVVNRPSLRALALAPPSGLNPDSDSIQRLLQSHSLLAVMILQSPTLCLFYGILIYKLGTALLPHSSGIFKTTKNQNH